MKTRTIGLIVFAAIFAIALDRTMCAAEAETFTDPANGLETTNVFVCGTEGINTYRIPSIITAPDGSLLVFCEARKESIADASPTDMILRRSLDQGKTWQPMQILVRGQGTEAIMNPVVIVDRPSGTIVLLCVNINKVSEGHNRHLLLTSRDCGKTWSDPVDMGSSVRNYDDRFVPGPGIGIQTKTGRLVAPGYIGEPNEDLDELFYSCVIYSDDHGKTWTQGAPVSELSDESQVVELRNGDLMLNMRGNMGMSCRGVALSKDGGATWSRVRWDRALHECPCQASIVRYGFAKQDKKDRLLFANPDNSGEKFGILERTRMTVRMSYDEGKTWPVAKLIHAGPSSYSGLVRLANGDIGLLFEGGERHRREWIRFVRIPLAWLTDGKDAL